MTYAPWPKKELSIEHSTIILQHFDEWTARPT